MVLIFIMSSPKKGYHDSPGLPALNSNLLKSLTSVHLPPPPSATRSQTTSSIPTTSLYQNHGIPTTAMSFDARGPEERGIKEKMNNMPPKTSVFPTPLSFIHVNGSKSGSPYVSTRGYNKLALTDISNPILNTPPPSQIRSNGGGDQVGSNFVSGFQVYHQVYNTPTLAGGKRNTRQRDDESNKENLHHMLSPANSSPIFDTSTFKQVHVPARNFSSSFQHGNFIMQPTNKPKLTRQQQKTKQLDEIPAPEDMPPIVDDGSKPPYSYATLIGMAILRSCNRKLTLSQIYQWINDTFEWYKRSKSGWQNSIRHNLSLNKAFKKQERPKGDPGKGNYWLVESGYEEQFITNIKNARRSSSIQLGTDLSAVNQQHPQAEPFGPKPTFFTHPNTMTVTTPFDYGTQRRMSVDSSVIGHYKVDNRHVKNETFMTSNDHFMLNTNNNKHHYQEDDFLRTPMKRSNTAIGLQHISTFSSVDSDSPSSKRTISDITAEANKEFEDQSKKKKRPNPKLNDQEIPNLSAPDTMSSYTQRFVSNYKINESPVRQYVNSDLILGPLKPALTLLPPTMSSQKIISPNTSIRNHRAMVGLPSSPSGCSFEYEDMYSSPSAKSKLSQLIEADDAISIACFGSPDKREAKRRQYYEHSGTSLLDGIESVTDVFGVDICDVVRRAVESKKDKGDSTECASGKVQEKDNDLGFDSPIKSGYLFSPPKTARKN